MNKYQLLAFFDLTSTIYVLFIVVIAASFKNYWLLFLILLVGLSDETRDKILASNGGRA